jgi:hypothetical protein
MDRLKRIIVLLIVFLTAVILTAHAQFPGGPMGPWGSPFGSPSSPLNPFPGLFGMSSPVAYNIENSDKDLMAVIDSTKELSLFSQILKNAGYDRKLGGDYYMVFAPSDKALKRDMPVSSVQALNTSYDLVHGIIDNCLVRDPPDLDIRMTRQSFGALNGKKINVRREKEGVTANGADILKIVKTPDGMLFITDGAVGT